ncbi:MAG: YbaN family protein [Candidatus Nanopelagicales bacterium]
MTEATPPAPIMIEPNRTRRYALLVCGWSNVVLGMIGAVVPGMPTTVFLIIALWAFTQSSPRMRAWLYNHPRYGVGLRAWERHGVIPPRAKCLAVSMMTVSLAIIAVVATSWILPAAVGGVMALVALFILTRPGRAARETGAAE